MAGWRSVVWLAVALVPAQGQGLGKAVDESAAPRLRPRPKSQRIQRDQDILALMLEDSSYDSRVRPRGLNDTWPNTGGPVIVKINMLLRSISKIDDVNMEYSCQITFREEWVDRRLAYAQKNIRMDKGRELPEFLVLPPKGEIWMPDSFFQNEKQARKHSIDKPNVLIRIYKDGGILYSVRISLVLSCPMDLRSYPFDVQICRLDVASYAYTSNDIAYVWKGGKAIQLKEAVRSSLPSFELANVTTGYCTSKTNTGEYSCLRTTLILKRQLSYYLLQLYIPSSMLVIVSWVSFWLDRSAVPARVTLGVTTLLTMTTQSNGINAKLPPVSYTKAIDVWIGVCLALIFGALLEFACVTYVGDMDVQKRKNKAEAAAKRREAADALPQTPRPPPPTDAAVMLANLRSKPKAQPRALLSLDDEDGALPWMSKYVYSIPHPMRSAELDPRCTCPTNPLLATGRGGKGGGGNSPMPTHIMAFQYQHNVPVSQVMYSQVYGLNGEEAGLGRGGGGAVYGLSLERSRSARSLLGAVWRRVKKLVGKFVKEKDRSKRIDYCSRLFFPLIFISFNAYYWHSNLSQVEETLRNPDL